MEGRSIFPALMPFLYFQQGLFEDHSDTLEGEANAYGLPEVNTSNHAAVPANEVDEEGDLQRRLRALRAQRAELQAKVDLGALKENEVLTSKVVTAQEEFLALQGEFKSMKEEYNQQLEGLRVALEEQQEAAEHADRRVMCAEDLVRFHQEQRRMMASHWKQQCQSKDESIRNLNRRLIEYSTDWQHLGLQRQTEAGLSHEYFCLDDRHQRLLERQQGVQVKVGRLEQRLSEAETEEQNLRAELQAASEAHTKSCASSEALAERLEAKRHHYEAETAEQLLPGSHRCIWRDQLDVREGQLEKISAQEERIVTALQKIQGALAEHSAKHQEMKLRHSEAETKLRESERLRIQRQRRCQELEKSESALRRLLEVVEAGEASPGWRYGARRGGFVSLRGTPKMNC